MSDLHCSDGRVSSMPGSSHPFPDGSKCDEHPDRPAVARVQGETDSFGCEYFLACQECRDKQRAFAQAEYESEKYCAWCKSLKKHVSPHRDYEEGMAGPLYDVCSDCKSKETARLEEELNDNGRYESW